jgi:L-threonylcarbamoyladenylate synthase
MHLFELYSRPAAELLKAGDIGVFPAETVYGIGTSAFSKASVDAIFELKKRPAHKPFAVLIADFTDLRHFGIAKADIARANRYWPGANTVILSNSDKLWQYLHRDSGGLSFRIPAEPHFRDFLRITGPLATTSANIAGEPTITSPEQGYALFGDAVSIYMPPSPYASGQPSTVIDLKNDDARTLRH